MIYFFSNGREYGQCESVVAASPQTNQPPGCVQVRLPPPARAVPSVSGPPPGLTQGN
jgi:hypothetical protein